MSSAGPAAGPVTAGRCVFLSGRSRDISLVWLLFCHEDGSQGDTDNGFKSFELNTQYNNRILHSYFHFTFLTRSQIPNNTSGILSH